MFIDTAKINVASGSGGNGCNSFFRDKRLSHPRPNGGPGGCGGHIVIKADSHIHTLLDFKYRRHFKAEDGSNGGSNDKKGSNGKDCIIKVPVGTVIKDASLDLVLRDLGRPGEEVIVCEGGAGGRANAPFKEATPGGPGKERDLFFELKLLADVGIVGFPNAGKSTLIWKISNARPRIANFPFTTKAPVLGIVRAKRGRDFVVCEIPGLIEGAHLGKGLGYQFLRHTERTKVLIHLVDMAGVEGRRPLDDYTALNNELGLFSKELAKKPQILAVNKMDIPSASQNLAEFKKAVRKKSYAISGATGYGISELIEAVWKGLAKR